jgi:predicted NUDIX family NTP pyrophosphohydrolase
MKKISCGLLLYKKEGDSIQVFLVHPGGPFFAKKDLGVWSIPKGEPDDGEAEYLEVAKREFEEETGKTPTGEFIDLGSVIQNNGKEVFAWAFAGDFDQELKSNTFDMEWPPRSGKKQAFPEVDRGGFFDAETAKQKTNPAQAELIDRLIKFLQ